MIIRVATPADKKQTLKLFDEFAMLLGGKEQPSQTSKKIFDIILDRKDAKIFVAEEDKKLLGVVTFYLIPNITRGWQRGHIEEFFVTRAARNKGVGTQLLSYIKIYCMKHAIKIIKVSSNNTLTSAHRFYEKNGGKITESIFKFETNEL